MVDRRDVLKLGAVAALGTGLGSGIGAAVQETGTTTGFYLAGLTGGQEPEPVETAAEGGALFAASDDGSELAYAVAAGSIENVFMAHIHQGRPGEDGPVVVWLYPGPDEQTPELLEGRFDGVLAQGTITEEHLVGPLEGESLDALLEAIRSGNAYVNVHTEQNQGGEIRGQLLGLDALAACLVPDRDDDDDDDDDGVDDGDDNGDDDTGDDDDDGDDNAGDDGDDAGDDGDDDTGDDGGDDDTGENDG